MANAWGTPLVALRGRGFEARLPQGRSVSRNPGRHGRMNRRTTRLHGECKRNYISVSGSTPGGGKPRSSRRARCFSLLVAMAEQANKAAANAGRNYSLQSRDGLVGFDSLPWRRSLARAGPPWFRPSSSPLQMEDPANADKTTGSALRPIGRRGRMFKSSPLFGARGAGKCLVKPCCRSHQI